MGSSEGPEGTLHLQIPNVQRALATGPDHQGISPRPCFWCHLTSPEDHFRGDPFKSTQVWT